MPESEQDIWFNEYVQPFDGQLRAYLKGKFPTLEDQEDVVQESYARLMRAYGTGKVKDPKALLFAIARNVVYDLFRRRKIVQFESLTQNPGLSVLESEVDIEEAVSLRDEIDLLARAVKTLPPRCRQVMTLRMVYGFRTKEIACELGISDQTVKAQLAKGMRRTADYLAEYEDP